MEHSHPILTSPEQAKAELRTWSKHRLHELMGECPVEPADFDGCLACAAYEEVQNREAIPTVYRIEIMVTPVEGNQEPNRSEVTDFVRKRLLDSNGDYIGTDNWEIETVVTG